MAVDWRNRRIYPGCHVVYPVRASSSHWVNEAEVLEVRYHEPTAQWPDPRYCRICSDHPGHSFPQCFGYDLKVKVIRTTGYGTPNSRPRWLRAIERVTRVEVNLLDPLAAT